MFGTLSTHAIDSLCRTPGVTTLTEIRADAVPSLVAYVFFLWLGIYLISRSPQSLLPRLAGLSMLSLCVYLLGVTLVYSSTTKQEAMFYTTLFWFGQPLPEVLWLHTILELAGLRGKRRKHLLAGLYASAFLLIFLGWFTKMIINPEHGVFDLSHVPVFTGERASIYWIFVLFITSTLLAACLTAYVFLIKNRDHLERGLWPQHLSMFIAAIFFFVGGTVLAMDSLFVWRIPESYLQIILLIGVLTMAYCIVNYNGLVEGQILRKDFWSTLIGAHVVATIFTIALYITNASLLVSIVAGSLAIILYQMIDPFRSLLDRLFFSEAEQDVRMGLRDSVRFVGIAQTLDLDLIDSAVLNTLVLDAIKKMYSPVYLLSSPLISLRTVKERLKAKQGDNQISESRACLPPVSQDRANELSLLLKDLVEGLRHGLEWNSDRKDVLGDEWGPYASLGYYVFLHKPVGSQFEKELMRWRTQKNAQYFKKLKEFEQMAVKSVAQSLKELEKHYHGKQQEILV